MDIAAAIISGILSGLASGVAAGIVAARIFVTRASNSGNAPSALSQLSGRSRGNQTATNTGSGQAFVAKRDNINQNLNALSAAYLTAEVVRKLTGGTPAQALIITNAGDHPAEDIVASPKSGGGGFIHTPDWALLPTTIAGHHSIELPCVTSGAGLVEFIVQYRSQQQSTGPIQVQAAHR